MAIVLKSPDESEKDSAAREVSGLAGFNLNDLADQGIKKLEACRSEVSKLLAEANKEAEAIKEEARKQGHQEGIQQAQKEIENKIRNEATQRAKQQLAVTQQATTDLLATYDNWMKQYADSLNSIAIAAAEKIVCRRLDTEREIIVQWTENAIRSTRAATKLAIAVHPETLAELGQVLDELLSSADLPEQTIIVPDDSLRPTDVVIRQTGGEIQAGLHVQLERLKDLLQ